MGTPLALSNGTILQRSSGGILRRSAVAAPRTWQIVNSYKSAIGLSYTNFLRTMANPFQDLRDGSTARYDGSVLEDQGHIARDGTIVSMPVDAQIDACWLYSILRNNQGGMDEFPSVYNGRTIVFKIISGTIGDGNTLSFQNATGETLNVINSTGAAYRAELPITAVENWVGELIPRINFGGTKGAQSRLDQLALLSNAKLAMFFKDEEARFNDRFNNPWKEWSPAFCDVMDNWDILRPMDQMGNHTNAITHIKDFNQQDDPCWGGGTKFFEVGSPIAANTHSRRMGHSPEVFLNLCENGSPSGNPWTGWIDIPICLGSPIRAICHSLVTATASQRTYYVDGVQQQFSTDDNLFWFDPAFVDLSTITVVSGPTMGAIASVDTTTGRVIYNPSAGTPWPDGENNGDESITFQFNRIDYDLSGGGNAPSTGAQVTFEVPIRILWNGAELAHYCRIRVGDMWTRNKAWFQDANRWQSNVRSLVDAIVASGYSTTRPLYVEMGNETWNTFTNFAALREWCVGVAEAHRTEWEAWQTANSKNNVQEELGGVGLLLAYLRKYVEDELSSRSLSYNLKWICSSQTANSSFAKAMTQGHLFALDDIFGYTAQQQTDAMAGFYAAGTSYTNQSLTDLTNNPDNNISGTTGTAHEQWILDRFDGTEPGYPADSSGLKADIISWLTGETIKSQNNAWVVSEHNEAKSFTEGEGGNWFGDYEGGDHQQNLNIPSAVTSSPRTNSAGQTFSEWYQSEFNNGQARVDVARDLYEKRIANDPNDHIAAYGWLQSRTWGAPWQLGLVSATPKIPEIQMIIDEYGRL